MAVIKVVSAKNILTKSKLPRAEYSVNPYIGCTHACKYCYASYMAQYTQHLEQWGTFVDVKSWPEDIITQKYNGREIFIGSVTDAYQPCEAKYKRTRILLEQLQKTNAKITIITKSDLVLRDIDLIKSFPEATVGWSLNTLDENFRKNMDSAVSIERRLTAMKIFREAGVITVCFVAPIFPKITDCQRIVLTVKNLCSFVWLDKLNLRGVNRTKILRWIYTNYRELYSFYYDIYVRGNQSYWKQLDVDLKKFAINNRLNYVYDNWSGTAVLNNLPTIVNYFTRDLIIKNKVFKYSYRQ